MRPRRDEAQTIVVVTTEAAADHLRDLRRRLRQPLVLTAPTPAARWVVERIGAPPTPEILLAPVTLASRDRGHELDALVRRHAVVDRWRDVVVVTDPASATLLVARLTDGDRPTGAVTVIGLPRPRRRVPGWKIAVTGLALAVVAGLLSPALNPFALLGAGLVLFGVLALVPATRPVGRAALAATGIALVIQVLAISSAARFPTQ